MHHEYLVFPGSLSAWYHVVDFTMQVKSSPVHAGKYSTLMTLPASHLDSTSIMVACTGLHLHHNVMLLPAPSLNCLQFIFLGVAELQWERVYEWLVMVTEKGLQ